MAKKTTRSGMPKFDVGRVRVRAARGPRNGNEFYWRAVVYQDSKEHTVWRGWRTRHDAESEVAAALAAGDLEPSDSGKTETAIPRTVRDLILCWDFAEKERRDIKEKTKTTNFYYARQIATSTIQDVPLRHLQLAHLERLRDDRLGTGASSQVVQHEIRTLRRAWTWGRGHRYCPDRDLPRPRLKVRNTRDKWTPSRDDVLRVLRQMDADKWPFVALLLIAETGMRVGEVAALRWSDVDTDQQTVHVPDKCKTGWRPVPISDALTAFLARLRGDRDADCRVLLVTEDTVRTSLSQRYIPRACEAAKVRRFTPHGVRRMVVDSVYNAGTEPTVAGALLGQSPQTAARYYRSVPMNAKRSAKQAAGLADLAENVIPFPGPPRAAPSAPSTVNTEQAPPLVAGVGTGPRGPSGYTLVTTDWDAWPTSNSTGCLEPPYPMTSSSLICVALQKRSA